jgi:MFS superfamily sulfate permease-like transporter/CRP-like cAMP-binding protein
MKSRGDWRVRIGGDVAGGAISAVLAIPLAMGYGMFAFVSLGENYFATGALAGLYTAFIVAIVCLALGDKTTTVYAPRINSTFFLGLLIYGLVHSESPAIRSGGVPLVLALTFCIVMIGGLFEALFGVLRLGTLIKFAPQPVMAGFQNAAAILLFLVQLGNVSGFDYHMPFKQVPHHLGEIRPLSIAIGVLTFATMWNFRRLSGKVPPLVGGIVVGTGAYYACVAAGLAGHLGPVVASQPRADMGLTAFPYLADLARSSDVLALAPTVVGAALALAIIAAIDALLCAKLVTPLGEPAPESNRLLMRLGAGNVAAAWFGGITSGINIGPSVANRAFGGRTSRSVLVNAIALVLACTLLFPLAGHLPRVVLSAVIMVVAVQHVDPWTLRLARGILSGATPLRSNAALELLVIVAVAVLSIALDIVLAVFIGIAIAVMLFAVSMSRSIVRRAYRCDAVRSRKARTASEREILQSQGNRVMVMELQGALFFGTGERLAAEIDAGMRRPTRFVILDLRRVSEIDSTGARVLLDIEARLSRSGAQLLLAFAPESRTGTKLDEFGVRQAIGTGCLYSDLDRAIEHAEDELLGREPVAAGTLVPQAEIGLFERFSADEIAAVKTVLDPVSFRDGATIFREGELGEEMLLITNGSASALLRTSDGGVLRLATYGPGTMLGEMAIIDGGRRSASVVATGDVTGFVLTRGKFAELAETAPALAVKLLENVSRELSARLRLANRTIQQLEG